MQAGKAKVDQAWVLRIKDLDLSQDLRTKLRRDFVLCHRDAETRAVRNNALTTLVLNGDGTGILMLGRYADSAAPLLLKAVPQPFGGWRWWFVEPDGNGLCSTLYLPRDGARFVSRKALGGISYRSQRMAPRRRAEEKARSIRLRLRGSADISAPFPPRPAGMHKPTFDRLKAAAEAAAAIALGHPANVEVATSGDQQHG